MKVYKVAAVNKETEEQNGVGIFVYANDPTDALIQAIALMRECGYMSDKQPVDTSKPSGTATSEESE